MNNSHEQPPDELDADLLEGIAEIYDAIDPPPSS